MLVSNFRHKQGIFFKHFEFSNLDDGALKNGRISVDLSMFHLENILNLASRIYYSHPLFTYVCTAYRVTTLKVKI